MSKNTESQELMRWQVIFGALGVIATCLAIAVSVLNPEIRHTLGLDGQSRGSVTEQTANPTTSIAGSVAQPTLVLPTLVSTPGSSDCARNQIAFISNDANNITSISIMNIDGTELRTLADPRSASASWSPDGCLLTYTSYEKGHSAISVMNPNGTGQHSLTDLNHYGDAQWSPDGRHITFMAQRDSNWEIYVMNSDGTDQRRLTNQPSNDNISPQWSPDGNFIVFSSQSRDASNFSRIDVISLEGTNRHRITEFNSGSPTWSPDGRTIVYVGGTNDNVNLYSINSDGTKPQKLTQYEGYESSPMWSPDGRTIAFYSKKDGGGIYLMNADGSNQHKILDFPGYVFGISWSPLK